jgi:hypothetical protein
MNDSDFEDNGDYDHDEARAGETLEQKLARHITLSGVPAVMKYSGEANYHNGYFNEVTKEFLFLRTFGDSVGTYHTTSFKQGGVTYHAVLGGSTIIGVIDITKTDGE